MAARQVPFRLGGKPLMFATVQQTLPQFEASCALRLRVLPPQEPCLLSDSSWNGCCKDLSEEECTSEVGHLLLVRGKQLRRQGKLHVVGHQHLCLVLLGGRPQRPPGIQVPLVHHVHLHTRTGSPQLKSPETALDFSYPFHPPQMACQGCLDSGTPCPSTTPACDAPVPGGTAIAICNALIINQSLPKAMPDPDCSVLRGGQPVAQGSKEWDAREPADAAARPPGLRRCPSAGTSG